MGNIYIKKHICQVNHSDVLISSYQFSVFTTFLFTVVTKHHKGEV